MGGGISYAQNDTEEVVEVPSNSMQVAVMQDNMKKVTWNTDPLSPAKAAFYSAVIPGLGQIYNKSYWKVPLVYIAIGTPIYFYTLNIIEANVDAHLKQFNVDEQLTLEPFIHNDLLTQPQFGLTLTYKSKR